MGGANAVDAPRAGHPADRRGRSHTWRTRVQQAVGIFSGSEFYSISAESVFYGARAPVT